MKFTSQHIDDQMTLNDIYLKHKRGDWPDKGSTHSYIQIYKELLAAYRHSAKNILEIGLMSGESLRMWDEYFDGNVYGIDCDLKPINGLADLSGAINDGLKVSIGDASNPLDIGKFYRGIMFDVVIEDASHNIEQQLAIYKTLKSYLADGAIYIIEDVQDIDSTRPLFEIIDTKKRIDILDLRTFKKRYDDVLIVIR